MKKSEIVNELLTYQIQNIKSDKKLQYNDIQRISKYITTSIFNKTDCCIWNGYITNYKSNKGTYINFYFRNKKTALHRLLYINYVEELHEDDYLKFTCDNKGTCCNVTHMFKNKYKIDEEVIIKEPKILQHNNLESDNEFIISLS